MAKSEKDCSPIFFATPKDFRAWLKQNHATMKEQWVGFYRKASRRPSITWPESVDEALCVGWIDGLRKSIDTKSYMIRFTPRKSTSNWSAVNIGRVAELKKRKRMQSAGLRAFAARMEAKSGIYSYEQRQHATLDQALVRQFRANPAAWKFFQAQPPGYRKLITWWLVSVKQETTRQKRLQRLMEESAAGRRLR